MKFETKYLIRWGIPGWVLIFWIFFEVLFWKGINPLESSFADLSKGLTLLISLAAIGVPVGYILHQIYFGLAWVASRRETFSDIADEIGEKFPKTADWGSDSNQDYYQFEYVWHAMLLNQCEETRNYLEGRYRYLLGTVHGLGALALSSVGSLTGTLIIIVSNVADFPFNLYFWAGLAFQLAIFLSALVNYKYFSANLRAFQVKMLKTYL